MYNVNTIEKSVPLLALDYRIQSKRNCSATLALLFWRGSGTVYRQTPSRLLDK